jgi:hypothetical protein
MLLGVTGCSGNSEDILYTRVQLLAYATDPPEEKIDFIVESMTSYLRSCWGNETRPLPKYKQTSCIHNTDPK